MLARQPIPNHRVAGARGQRGVVLMIALIMLVAMTLAGLALIRSVDTTNIIAGNLAFQQAATSYGDIGTENAVTWLQTNSGGSMLYADDSNNGYSSSVNDPVAGQSWDNFWSISLSGRARTLAADGTTGNTVTYAIQRLCNMAGLAPSSPNQCAVSTVTASYKNPNSGEISYALSSQVYYRITARISGPRNTVSYIQTIVAI